MKKNEVQIHAVYLVKVGSNLAQVEIVSEHPNGGWEGKSLKTGKAIRIKSSQRLRQLVAQPAAPAKQPRRNTNAPTTADTGEPGATDGQRKPLSLLNAAAIVLEACERPLSCREIIEKALDAEVWQPGAGKTPANTLYSSILREIKIKGSASRFVKAERGKFALNSQA